MSASTATLGTGTTLKYGSTLLAEVMDLDLPEQSVQKVDISNHDSPDKKREYIAGWISQSDPSATLVYLKAAATALQTMIDAKTVSAWTITFPDGSTLVFNAFLMALSIAAPLEDKMTQRIGFAITDSDVTFTAGA